MNHFLDARRLRPVLALNTLLLASVGASGAMAQASTSVQEIVVTAERREVRLLDTPLAVAAIGEKQVQRQGIDRMERIQAVTPNMTFGTFSNYSIVSLRGVGTDFGTIAAEPAVATFQDGVYLGSSSAQNVPAIDNQRVEVLRGPQGTLYGRNSTGGAINFITRSPSFTPEANGDVTLGAYNRVTAGAGVSGPLVKDKLAARVSALFDEHSGYRDNLFNGGREDRLHAWSGAGSLLFTPTEDFKLTLRADGTDRKTSTPYERLADVAFPAAAFGGASVPNPAETRKFLNDFPTATTFQVWGVSATAEATIHGATLRSITAYRDTVFHSTEDWDGSSANILGLHDREETKQLTQEVNLFGTAGDGKLDWLVGGFYYRAHGRLLFDYTGGVLGVLAPGLTDLVFDADQISKSGAGFGQATWHVNDRLNITLGARYTHDEKTMTQGVIYAFGPAKLNTCGATNITIQDSWNAATGTLSADYHVSPTAMIYGRVARGFKAGGINPGACADTFAPEYVTAYETGLKGAALGGQVHGSLTAFYYDYKDIQFTTFKAASAVIKNAAGAKVSGVEVEFDVHPNTLPGLAADGSLSYLHSEYKRAPCDAAVIARGDDSGSCFWDPFHVANLNVGGNQLVRAPKWKANLGLQYAWDALGGQLTLRGETSYSAHYFHDIFNAKAPGQSATREPSYTISNLRLIWARKDGDYEVQAFVENIENNMYAYRRFVGAAWGGIIAPFSPPRTAGVKFVARLGR